MTRIKICGLTHREDIRVCVEVGVQALGFVVEYPANVPWNVDRRVAGELMQTVPPFVARVIVVGDNPDTVVQLTEQLRPHAVQLHGNEPVEVTAQLVSRIHALGSQVIKPLRFSVETGKCTSPGEDPLAAAGAIAAVGVDALLLDSMSESRPAGTGQSIDWSLACKIRQAVHLPVILAGGLHARNVSRAVAAVKPYAVDVISGVEKPGGGKDPAKLRAFVEAVRGAAAHG